MHLSSCLPHVSNVKFIAAAIAAAIPESCFTATTALRDQSSTVTTIHRFFLTIKQVPI